MIDELIPDLADPKLRALYDSLLGKRTPSWIEKAVLLTVAGEVQQGLDVLGTEAERIYVVLERAWRIDRKGVMWRLHGWFDEAKKRAGDDKAGG